jgi:predicted lysophospholipase L1 biosynthesis ABC-type transport system permease subunit
VVIVNQKLATSLWPGQDPVGQTVLIDGPPDPPAECQVVGVVGNARQNALEQEAEPEIYLPSGGRELIVRTSGTVEALVPAVRAALREIEPNMATNEFKSLGQMVEQLVSPKRLVAVLLGLFSLLALLLAAVGIYGVIAYSVSQRTNEIGIRLALGSPHGSILRLVIGQGMRVILVGCVLGILGALALTRVLRALLFGVSPTDPLTFVVSALLLLAVALLACWVPARRAMRVDPMGALRGD